MIIALVEEAVEAGARREPACALLGLSARSVERWRTDLDGEDGRHGPKTTPANSLTDAERRRVLEVANQPAFRDLSPKQIVPRLAELGEYVASESSFYRELHKADQMTHRQKSRPPKTRHVPRHQATGPNQVWCWDITYLRSPINGMFFYLYLIIDLWSRKIVGFTVEQQENDVHAANLFQRTCRELGLDPAGLVLHSDNGHPMKGSTMKATLERLGVIQSLSRPSVSDDNAYVEALFRTMKYRPNYPGRPFESVAACLAWVTAFVSWYNEEHRHSAIAFVTPEQRHLGADVEVLAKRRSVYERARRKHPERWSRGTRAWNRPEVVELNPLREHQRPAKRAVPQRAESGAIAPPITVVDDSAPDAARIHTAATVARRTRRTAA